MNLVSKRVSFLLAALAAAFVPAAAPLSAATTTPFTTGLFAPSKIALSSKGNLLVAEAGYGPNTGRVSIIDPGTGARRTLLDHLPAGFSIPEGAPSGPSGLAMRGRTLYVVIGLGDAVINTGTPQGTQIPNPHPSSPIFSSVLAVHFSANAEMTATGFTLSLADQTALKSGATLSLDAGGGDKLTIELVADFPDYVPEPVPANAANVRQSNPFGIVIVGETLYINDASANTVRSVDLATGAISTVTTFPRLPNPLSPFGPPTVEAVPTSVRAYKDQLLVSLLSGFPFPPNQAQVRLVDPNTGTSAPFIEGLTSALDVLVENDGFLTLEFSANMLGGLPGRIRSFATPTATPVVIVATLITPTSMVRTGKSGPIFVTENGMGRIMKVTP